MIKIGVPKITVEEDKAIVTCDILINDTEKTLFYEIDKEYKKYLCIERSDAFVIPALYYAMKNHYDIYCEVPMTSELYHNITTYLIPTLAKHSDRLKEIKLNIPITDEKIETYGAVGTGISCGIDSFHVVKNYMNPKYEDMKLTCLCLNNVGSFKAYKKVYRGIGEDKARDEVVKKAKKVAKELDLPLIITNSNLSRIFPEVYYRVHTFSNMFSVFLMQKYFSKYYYASGGWDLSHYNVIDNYELDSAEYEILIFYCLQTPSLKVYCEGHEKTRLEKTISIADFKPAQENLHVCIKDSTNCGKCMKCRRTLLMLDTIGKLENFKKVFDINYYNKHKKEYIEWLKKEEAGNHEMNVVTAKLLRQKNNETGYKNIDEFNKRNIIIPKLDINSISIKKDKFILNKLSKKTYDSQFNKILTTCILIAKNKNKKISIPKYYLDNVKEIYKNKTTLRKKLGYIKRIITKKSTKINLYDLIYFILYKPVTSDKILKHLINNNIVKLDKNIETNTRNLSSTFEQFLKYKILLDAINIEEKTIKDNTFKNNNNIIQIKDAYYKNTYDETFILKDKNMYYFVGKTGEYYVSAINYLNNNKNQILEETTKIKGIINKL